MESALPAPTFRRVPGPTVPSCQALTDVITYISACAYLEIFTPDRFDYLPPYPINPTVMTAPPHQRHNQSPIDLLCGWPNPALLPAPDLLRSATTVLTTPSIAQPGLSYGPDEGYEPLRAHVAQWLGNFYQPCHPISPGRICITGGASQNLACVMAVFTDPVYTRAVWMVDPTYHLAGRMMDDAGFAGRVYGVPEDDEGIDLAFLENGLRAAEEKAHAEGNTEPVST